MKTLVERYRRLPANEKCILQVLAMCQHRDFSIGDLTAFLKEVHTHEPRLQRQFDCGGIVAADSTVAYRNSQNLGEHVDIVAGRSKMGVKRLLKRNAKPTSRKALAAVCAAASADHTAHLSSTHGFTRWLALIAAQTAASALRLEGR